MEKQNVIMPSPKGKTLSLLGSWYACFVKLSLYWNSTHLWRNNLCGLFINLSLLVLTGHFLSHNLATGLVRGGDDEIVTFQYYDPSRTCLLYQENIKCLVL